MFSSFEKITEKHGIYYIVTSIKVGKPQFLSTCFAHGRVTNLFTLLYAKQVFTFMIEKTFSKWGPVLKEKICSYGSKYFLLRVDFK